MDADDLHRRRHFAVTWHRYKAGLPLDDDHRRLAHCMADHPEWICWWEASESEFAEGPHVPYVTVQREVNAEGHIVHHELARATYQRLRVSGFDHRHARDEIANAIRGVATDMVLRGLSEYDAEDKYRAALEHLALHGDLGDFFEASPE